jgi:maltose alpha-D-glucosyltransferase/alpha-amylase
MIAVRKNHPAFGWGDFTWVDSGSLAVAAHWRIDQRESILCLANLAPSTQTARLALLPGVGMPGQDLLSDRTLALESNQDRLVVPLQPFEYLWLGFPFDH